MTDPGPDDGLRNSFYRKTTRSSRRMTPARRLLYKLAVPVGLGIIRMWLGTCRVVRVVVLRTWRPHSPRRRRWCRVTGINTSFSAPSTCSISVPVDSPLGG